MKHVVYLIAGVLLLALIVGAERTGAWFGALVGAFRAAAGGG